MNMEDPSSAIQDRDIKKVEPSQTQAEQQETKKYGTLPEAVLGEPKNTIISLEWLTQQDPNTVLYKGPGLTEKTVADLLKELNSGDHPYILNGYTEDNKLRIDYVSKNGDFVEVVIDPDNVRDLMTGNSGYPFKGVDLVAKIGRDLQEVGFTKMSVIMHDQYKAAIKLEDTENQSAKARPEFKY